MFGHVAVPMSSLQCVEGYIVTLNILIINIRLDKNGQLRQNTEDVTWSK